MTIGCQQGILCAEPAGVPSVLRVTVRKRACRVSITDLRARTAACHMGVLASH